MNCSARREQIAAYSNRGFLRGLVKRGFEAVPARSRSGCGGPSLRHSGDYETPALLITENPPPVLSASYRNWWPEITRWTGLRLTVIRSSPSTDFSQPPSRRVKALHCIAASVEGGQPATGSRLRASYWRILASPALELSHERPADTSLVKVCRMATKPSSIFWSTTESSCP